MDLYPKPPSLNPPSEKEKWPEGFVTEDELLQKAVTIDQLNAVKGTGWNGETVKGISDQLITHLADTANPHQVKAEQVFALGGVPAGTAFPTSPASYTLFLRTDLKKLFVYLP